MAPKAMGLVIVLFACLNFKCNQASYLHISREEELDIERQLKLLNKPPITTFQTKEGDIIDCVDINKQPAFDHPLLKTHKLQTQPSRYPNNWQKVSSQSKHNLFISNNNRQPCPAGSVPIRRTLKKDLIRLRSLSSNQTTEMKDSTIGAVRFPYNKNVVSLSLKKGRPYYGINAHVSIYNLSVAQDQSSSANVWIVGGPSNALNVILAGWQVNPAVNGDSLTRLFVYWTADGGATTGCYNMLCQGFVQTNPMVTPDFPLYPSSTYRGPQNDYEFVVDQDSESGNWWLLLSESRTGIGYWPKELLGYLKYGAEQVAWGGIAKASPNGMSPPLGNSHKPSGKYYDPCYFRNINFITDKRQSQAPFYVSTVSYASNSNCYGLNIGNRQNCGDDRLEYCFTFGGPGGNNCRGSI